MVRENTLGELKTTEGVDLTAAEIAMMDLRGTELVTLSACESGLGDVKCGEGVYGLRRAFLYAGARTLVMSLAKVDDQTACDLMVEFYKRWLAGADKITALHDAALAMRKQHPFPWYWGMFVAAGDPN